MSCASRHQGRTAWCLPARDRGSKENGGDCVQGTCGRRFVKELLGNDVWARARINLNVRNPHTVWYTLNCHMNRLEAFRGFSLGRQRSAGMRVAPGSI